MDQLTDVWELYARYELKNRDFESFMEMWPVLDHLQRSHPVGAVHEEPKAQVTQADTGWKWSPGCHLCNVALPLWGWMNVQEVPSATYGDKYSKTLDDLKPYHASVGPNIQYTTFRQKKACVMAEVLQPQKPIHRASSAQLDSDMRGHLCNASTKWEFSTWVTEELRPAQSTEHRKPCSNSQHWKLLSWLKI